MIEPEKLRDVVRHLRQIGGNDIVVIDGEIYEVTARKLDTETVWQAVQSMLGQHHNNER